MTTIGTPLLSASRTVFSPPWVTTRAERRTNSNWGAYLTRIGFPAIGSRSSGSRPPPSETTSCAPSRSEEHTSELQSHLNLVCRLLLEKKKKKKRTEANEHIQTYTHPR